MQLIILWGSSSWNVNFSLGRSPLIWRLVVMTIFYHCMVLQAWADSAVLAPNTLGVTAPLHHSAHISPLPTELWLQWFSGSAKHWANARHCKVGTTTQSTELIPFYLVAGRAFNWLLRVARTRLWDWITWPQQPQRQRLYNDHAGSLQEHDTNSFFATH